MGWRGKQWSCRVVAFIIMVSAVMVSGGAQPTMLSAQPPSQTTRPSMQVQLAAGEFHTCALLNNGSVRCWGLNIDGRLGYGNTNNIGDNETPGSVGPVDLGAGVTATQITAGSLHTCALLNNGTVRCWGFGGNGRLGNGNTTTIGDDETPGSVGTVDLGAGVTATQITAGDQHTCALLNNGTVRCWGFGGNGRLGYGNTTTIGDDETPGSVGTVDLGAGLTATQITAGGTHTCALLNNGTVRCWGRGLFGRLGYGNTADIGDNETPGSAGTVDLGAGVTAAQITAGADHTCAVLNNGTVRCWGFGFLGQLGYGNTSLIGDDETPGSVGTVDVGAGLTATQITAGGSHTCAALNNGTVRCWGLGSSGRLGYGNLTTIGDNETPGSVGPVDLGAGLTATQITAGNLHTCALFSNGTVRCWGFSGNGRLGYGNLTIIGDNETPSSVGTVSLGVGLTATQITAGGNHTCALLNNGTVRCWGLGTSGQLGYGNTSNIGDNETPGSIGTVDLGAGVTAAQITAGGAHTCAVLNNSTVRCWGVGTSGQLGYGNTNSIGDNETPGSIGTVDLGAGLTATQISVATTQTCALLNNGTVRCWGLGSDGRLGYGNTNNIGDDETPGSIAAVDLGAGLTATQVTAGGSYACALLNNGTLRCWGLGSDGRLGYGNTTTIGDDETPGSIGTVDLGAGVAAAQITAGGTHACALLINGTVRCWGLGANGQLGYGNTNSIGDDETPGSVGTVSIVPATAPSAPGSVIATAGDLSVSLSWFAPLSDGGDAITGYTATAAPGGQTCTTTGALTCTVTGLTNGTAYTFTVTATNNIGTGPASAPSSSVTPQSPQTITFTNPGDQDFGTTPTLTASSNSALTVTFSSATPTVCTTTPQGALTFLTTGTCTIDADQSGNTVYLPAPTVTRSFTVNAVVPGAPTAVSVTAGGTDAVVTFTAPAFTGGDPITEYTVTASPGGATATGPTSPITVTGLANGIAYTFTVTATNNIGTGPASAASSATTSKAPQTITFTNPGNQDFGTTPTLTASSNSALTVTFSSATTAVCTTTPNGSLTFLTAGTCTIDADQTGNTSYLPAPTVTRSFTVNAIAPGAPVLTRVRGGNRQLKVRFAAPAQVGGSAVIDYDAEYSTKPKFAPGTGTLVEAGTSASPVITITGLKNAKRYYVRIRAQNSAGTGSWSARSTRKQFPVPKAPPAPKVQRSGSGRVTVTFARPKSKGSRINDYDVQYKSATQRGWKFVEAGRSTKRRIQVTGLRNGTAYRFRFRATTAAGNSKWSTRSKPITPAAIR